MAAQSSILVLTNDDGGDCKW